MHVDEPHTERRSVEAEGKTLGSGLHVQGEAAEFGQCPRLGESSGTSGYFRFSLARSAPYVGDVATSGRNFDA